MLYFKTFIETNKTKIAVLNFFIQHTQIALFSFVHFNYLIFERTLQDDKICVDKHKKLWYSIPMDRQITAYDHGVIYKNMSIRKNHSHTMAACCIGYVTQAAIGNFAPLLFLTFQKSYGIPLSKITLLISINFFVQFSTDIICMKIADRLGYRRCMVISHILCTCGFVGLATLPELLPDPFIGILLSVIIYALGGGFLEVLVTPIVEACPFKGKNAMVSILHSFYCWGVVLVIVISTVFFYFFGEENWKILALIWALIPLFNTFYFTLVPIVQLPSKENVGAPVGKLLSDKTFLLFVLLMLMAGATELSIGQWASSFAESALASSPAFAENAKAIGDLLGPCFFAVTMGVGRLIFAKVGDRVDPFMYASICGGICVICYLVASLVPDPMIALIGCGICGFGVGVMWPSTFSLATRHCRGAGTAMFGILSFAGDAGCVLGPATVGIVADRLGEGKLKTGLFAATIFPAVIIVGYLILCVKARKRKI